MRQIIVSILVLVSLGLLTPTIISAHTLKSDGSIGAVIHIDPDDDPVIGQEASFFFEFKDTKDKFKSSECSCLVTISKNDELFFSEYLTTNNSDPSLGSASFSFTFPEKGVYQIKVRGKPSNPGGFDDFELVYDLRVDRETGISNDSESFFLKNLHFFLLGGILVAFLTTLLYNRRKKNEK